MTLVRIAVHLVDCEAVFLQSEHNFSAMTMWGVFIDRNGNRCPALRRRDLDSQRGAELIVVLRRRRHGPRRRLAATATPRPR